MSDDGSLVRNWKNINPGNEAPGVNVYGLLPWYERGPSSVDVRLLTIEPGYALKTERFSGEAFYYFLAGNGILTWHHDSTDLSYLIDNDTVGWIPGLHAHSFENTGEGPMRCLAVTCKTQGTYKMRDGNFQKLNLVTPTIRKIADCSYGFHLDGAHRILGGGYQVFSPGKAQNDHSHEEEVIYLVRGKGKLITGGNEYELEAGSAALTPRNIKHRLINTGHDLFGYIVLEFAPEG